MKKNKNKKKKSNNRNKLIVLGCLAFLICCISIAYAVLSTSLNISGSGTVNASNWDIYMEYSNGLKTGSASYTIPTVTNYRIANYSVNLTKPGDSVSMYFNVYNDGDLNGEITSIINSTPVCTSETGNTADANLVCNNLDISFSYDNGDSIRTGDVLNTDSMFCLNGNTHAYSVAGIVVEISLKDSMTSVPSSKVTISNLNHEIIYSQTDKTCISDETCFVEGTKVLTKDGYKNIEEIKVGDYVYAMDLDTNMKELKEVKKTYKNIASETYSVTIGNHTVEATGKHKFYVIDKGWIRAYDLKVGDKLSSIKEVDTTITKINKNIFEKPIFVYNLEVEEFHNYLITEDDYLVHNGNTSYIPV